MRDNIYKTPLSTVKPFVFDDRVADVFADMISRSVPGYASSLELTASVCRQYAQADTKLYDLGCSLGAASLAMRHSIAVDNCKIIAVDNAQAMIERCQKTIERDHATTPVLLQCDDIQNIIIQNSSMVVMNYTLQFIPLDQRLSVLENIHAGLVNNGVLLLSEKITFDDPEHNQRLIDLHHEFKRLNGYDDLEIAQKRRAIDNVLLPETIGQHQQRLQQSGFSSVQLISQNLNFVTFLAIK